MDPLSISTAIFAFLDAANKFKCTLDKVSENRKKLLQLKQDIRRGLDDLEKFCRAHEKALNETEAVDLIETLSDLQSCLLYANSRCEAYHTPHSRTILATAKSNLKAWLKRNHIDDDIIRLKETIYSCHLRFIAFAGARIEMTSRRTEHSSLRMEQNLVVLHQEQREQLLNLETLVSKLLLNEHGQNTGTSYLTGPREYGEIDFKFLCRQVSNILTSLGRHYSQASCFRVDTQDRPIIEAFSFGSPLTSMVAHTPATRFQDSMIIALQVYGDLAEPTLAQPIQYYADQLADLAANLNRLHLTHDAAQLIDRVILVYDALEPLIQSPYFRRHRAWALETFAIIHRGYPEALSASKQALNIWQSMFDETGSNAVALELLACLIKHSKVLNSADQFEQGFDTARQSLILLQELPDLHYRDKQSIDISWTGSGESDVVLSSQRDFMCSRRRADDYTHSLWSIAECFAYFGRYSEARIAAMDSWNILWAVDRMPPYSNNSHASFREYIESQMVRWIPLFRHPKTKLELVEDSPEVRRNGSATSCEV